MELIAVMARYNPFAEHAGMKRILESVIHESIIIAIKRLEELGFTPYLLAVPEYNYEKLEGKVDQVIEILRHLKYPYSRRVAGAHGNYRQEQYKEWLKTVTREGLPVALCRLAQLNQPKIYLFWEQKRNFKEK